MAPIWLPSTPPPSHLAGRFHGMVLKPRWEAADGGGVVASQPAKNGRSADTSRQMVQRPIGASLVAAVLRRVNDRVAGHHAETARHRAHDDISDRC